MMLRSCTYSTILS